MCFQRAKWQREVVKDHKFDFVCTDDFKTNNVITKIKYMILFLIIIKIVLVYVADLWTAGILLIFNSWSSAIQPAIPIDKSKWIYVGCIFMSFILLIWDWKKARSIIASRDISYACTSIIAYRYYAVKDYSYYCFFREINKQKRRVDVLAFFIFFTFKGWKRLIFAEAPRQIVNAVTLYTIVQTNSKRDWMNLSAYGNSMVERLAMALMTFTLLSFAISATKLAIAFILYIPLLFHIRGNLKEYCCHKINKRIDELVRKESRKRRMNQRIIEQAMAKGDIAKGDINRLRKKHKNRTIKSMIARSKRQPTLPTFIDDDESINSSIIEPNFPEAPIPPSRSPPPPPEYVPIYNHMANVPPNIPSPEQIIPPYNNRYLNIPHNNPRTPPPPPQANYFRPPLQYTTSLNSNRSNSPTPSGPSHVRYQLPNSPGLYVPQNDMYNNNNYYHQMGYGRR